jgi:undecaprenyl-diphosphatase
VTSEEGSGASWNLRTTLLVLAGLVSCAAIVLAANANAGNSDLSLSEAMLLGLVEGVTEYLPVSSTAHLAIVQDALGLTSSVEGRRAADAYSIVIQVGAIAAVLGLYRTRVVTLSGAVIGRHDAGRSAALALVAAFAPAAIIGLTFSDLIKERLFSTWPIIAAWAIGALALLWPRLTTPSGRRTFESMTARDGLIVGISQSLALWPGTSRSLVTILAALAVGLSLAAAVEFSFLLGLITLGAATGYQLVADGGIIIDQFGLASAAVGIATAAITAWLAVRWMVDYLERHPLAIFGYYRLGLAALVTGVAAFTDVL